MKSHNPTIFIAAPFGNYIRTKNSISVHGTFTLYPQGNRVWSVLKSLRPSKEGWTNRLGLPNPGIAKGLFKASINDVISIAEVNRNEFQEMNKIIPQATSIELNLSCPNSKILPWDHIKQWPNKDRKWCIAKMSPLTTPEEIEYVLNQGFRQLHFSNTLPHKKGGLSGKSLIPYTKRLINIVRDDFKSYNIEIIAGGGVTTKEDITEYINEGADHISIGSGWFRPLKMRKLIYDIQI
mgnify:CR=1 FL=1